MEGRNRLILRLLPLALMAACATAEPTARASVDAGGADVGVGGASVGTKTGPVRTRVGTSGASVGVESGPVSADIGTGGPGARVELVETEDMRLNLGVGMGGPSASLGLGDLPFRLTLGPGGLGVGF